MRRAASAKRSGVHQGVKVQRITFWPDAAKGPKTLTRYHPD